MNSVIRPTIYLMVGLPYSGKSTFVQNHPMLSALTVVDSDSYIEKRALKENRSYGVIFGETIGLALAYRDELVEKCFKRKSSFVIDQTNVTKESRARWIEWANRHRYRIVVYSFALPPDEDALMERIKKRSNKVIPLSVLADMIGQYEKPSLIEGFDSVVEIDTFGS